MIAWLKGRKKVWFGAVGVVLAWGPVAQEAHFPAVAWWGLAGGIAGLFGIHAVKNDVPAPWNPAVKMVDGEAGQAWVGGLGMFLIGFLLGILWQQSGAHF